MSEYGSFQIDLITSEKAEKEKLEFLQSEILKLNFEKNLSGRLDAANSNLSVILGFIGESRLALLEL